jgi:hypothetical protein
MKTLFVLAAAVAVVSAAAPTMAQTPIVGVFFDEYLTRMDKACPPGGGADTAYVVAMNFNAYITGIEYAINYPASMSWVADIGIPPVTLGTTPSGIVEAWPLPLNGYNPIVVARVVFTWNCSGCVVTNDPIVVAPYPYSGFVRATDYPQYNFIGAVGMTSLVCPDGVPVDDATWGRIKALYGE